MRKKCLRRVRPAAPPMLVSRTLIESDIEVKERMFVQAFALGHADCNTFNEITDMRNVLAIAAGRKTDDSTLAMCEAMRVCMGNIRQRYTETGRMGASGDELRLLRAFCGVYRDFWVRQSVSAYADACDALHAIQATGALSRQATVEISTHSRGPA
jgi:hypothetical protein